MGQAESLENIVLVRYRDHVLYNRSLAMAMQPQIREAIGWLVYECDLYVTVSWDRDVQPPTLHGGDPKASGLVLLKSDILEFRKLPLKEISEWQLNSPQPTIRAEYALPAKEAKNSKKRKSK